MATTKRKYVPSWKRLRQLLESKEGKRVLTLLAKKPLQIEDKLGEYWSKEIDRIKEKDLLKIFVGWYGNKKEAKTILKKGRSEKVKSAIEASMWLLYGNFCRKVVRHIRDGKKLVRFERLDLEVQPSCHCITTMNGKSTTHWVAGSQQIVGDVIFTDEGDKFRLHVFHRFMSHPFWQHVGRGGYFDE
jgi:hypothetical protein